MSTEWFDRKIESPGVAQGQEDPSMLLIGDTTPDWVRLPPQLGGKEVRVLETFTMACPGNCGGKHKTHRLEDNYGVSECPTKGFLWFKFPQK